MKGVEPTLRKFNYHKSNLRKRGSLVSTPHKIREKGKRKK
jgi:hypothetical protein